MRKPVFALELSSMGTVCKSNRKTEIKLLGIKESDTGLAPPSLWDLPADKQMMQEEQPLSVSFLSLLCMIT